MERVKLGNVIKTPKSEHELNLLVAVGWKKVKDEYKKPEQIKPLFEKKIEKKDK